MTGELSPAGPCYPREPQDVTLADVYRLDFGRRTADLPTWEWFEAHAPAGPVVEIGIGSGRVACHLAARRRIVHGIDPEATWPAVRAAAGAPPSVRAHRGDASDPEAWAPLPTAALIVAAYSTLYLLPHEAQERALRLAWERLAPGGLLAVECFVPTLAHGAVVDHAVANPNGPQFVPWVRRSAYAVDAAAQTTTITRTYGPTVDAPTMRLVERLWWRSPAALAWCVGRVVGAATVASSPGPAEGPPVAEGHVVVWARRG